MLISRHDNFLSGSIPHSLQSLQHLAVLTLHENSLDGQISGFYLTGPCPLDAEAQSERRFSEICISILPARSMKINVCVYESSFNPVVFVKGKLILGFCNLAAIWLETQAAQERARDSARILYIQYMKISFLFSFISCLKIYCMYVDVYVCQELVGHEDIEQNPKRLSSCGFQKHGVSSYTPSQTHCPCVCVYVGGFAVDARTLSLGSLILSHFP